MCPNDEDLHTGFGYCCLLESCDACLLLLVVVVAENSAAGNLLSRATKRRSLKTKEVSSLLYRLDANVVVARSVVVSNYFSRLPPTLAPFSSAGPRRKDIERSLGKFLNFPPSSTFSY